MSYERGFPVVQPNEVFYEHYSAGCNVIKDYDGFIKHGFNIKHNVDAHKNLTSSLRSLNKLVRLESVGSSTSDWNFESTCSEIESMSGNESMNDNILNLMPTSDSLNYLYSPPIQRRHDTTSHRRISNSTTPSNLKKCYSATEITQEQQQQQQQQDNDSVVIESSMVNKGVSKDLVEVVNKFSTLSTNLKTEILVPTKDDRKSTVLSLGTSSSQTLMSSGKQLKYNSSLKQQQQQQQDINNNSKNDSVTLEEKSLSESHLAAYRVVNSPHVSNDNSTSTSKKCPKNSHFNTELVMFPGNSGTSLMMGTYIKKSKSLDDLGTSAFNSNTNSTIIAPSSTVATTASQENSVDDEKLFIKMKKSSNFLTNRLFNSSKRKRCKQQIKSNEDIYIHHQPPIQVQFLELPHASKLKIIEGHFEDHTWNKRSYQRVMEYWRKPSLEEKIEIRQELIEYKAKEMIVHESSIINTNFHQFRMPKDLERVNECFDIVYQPRQEQQQCKIATTIDELKHQTGFINNDTSCGVDAINCN